MKIDMTPHSITMRLRKTSELRRLCIALGGARLKRDCKIAALKQLPQTDATILPIS